MRNGKAVAGVLLCAAVLTASAATPLKLGSLFKDHMVVQAGTKVPVWGWAAPGAKVTVKLAGRTAKGEAGPDGRWMVRLKAVAAGGPYVMTVIAGDSLRVSDVLAGEVWLCSGQSNMQMAVEEVRDARAEITTANWPEIRMFSVARTVSDTAQDTCIGAWEPAVPMYTGRFSAVGYFFGRELHRQLKVPVGLIHSSWGGTPAESWTTQATLKADPELAPMFEAVEKLKGDMAGELAAYQARLAAWEKAVAALRDSTGRLPERQVDTGNKGFTDGWAKPGAEASTWKDIRVPGLWERVGRLDIDGAVWFRTTVQVPAGWAGKELRLSLGAIDDFDVAYWNGIKVGSTGEETPNFWQTPRQYLVPSSIVTGGPTVIAVRIFDHWGGGGFAGSPGQMSLVPTETATWTPVALAGTWKYRVERELTPLMPPAGPRGLAPQNEPVVLYNAMVNPLVPYAMRGAIWYQGEANAGRAYQYRRLLPAMINDWRTVWGQKRYAFGIVQLANFMERKAVPGPSEWAELREAQLMTVQADPQAGLAVIIDIGEGDNIHPKNKQDVGLRLALWAQNRVYGKPVEYSGPIYRTMALEGGKARLTFDHVGQGLEARGDSLVGFAIAGLDSQFVWARAKIEGPQVVVWSDKVAKPAAVRYAWADNPACNLYNKDGLPASPFRTDDWPGVTAGRK